MHSVNIHHILCEMSAAVNIINTPVIPQSLHLREEGGGERRDEEEGEEEDE